MWDKSQNDSYSKSIKLAFLNWMKWGWYEQASSGPRADLPQFPSAISVSSFYPQILCNVISSFKSTKKSKSKPAFHSLSYIQNRIFFFILS